jgi:hypothetical protein
VIDECWARKVAAREGKMRRDKHALSTPLEMLEATQLSVVNTTEEGTPEGDEARERLRETREMLERLAAELPRRADHREET